MDFEEAFAHYKEGTATPEETELVKAEIAKAKAISELIDEERIVIEPAPVNEVEKEDVKKAKKQFKHKFVIIALCSFVAFILVAGAILGGVFGFAASSANKSIEYGKEECIDIAINKFVEMYNTTKFAGMPEISAENCYVEDVDKDFHVESKLKNSFYTYEIEIEAVGIEGTMRIDTRTGEIYGRANIERD